MQRVCKRNVQNEGCLPKSREKGKFFQTSAKKSPFYAKNLPCDWKVAWWRSLKGVAKGSCSLSMLKFHACQADQKRLLVPINASLLLFVLCHRSCFFNEVNFTSRCGLSYIQHMSLSLSIRAQTPTLAWHSYASPETKPGGWNVSSGQACTCILLYSANAGFQMTEGHSVSNSTLLSRVALFLNTEIDNPPSNFMCTKLKVISIEDIKSDIISLRVCRLTLHKAPKQRLIGGGPKSIICPWPLEYFWYHSIDRKHIFFHVKFKVGLSILFTREATPKESSTFHRGGCSLFAE